jgi:hypothetical protein
MLIFAIFWIIVGFGLYKAMTLLPLWFNIEDKKNLKWYCALWPILLCVFLWNFLTKK